MSIVANDWKGYTERVEARVFIEKAVSAGIVGTLVTLLPWRTVVTLFIVLGQGHFLMAYLYQARAGKLTPAFLLRYLGWASLLLVAYWSHPFAPGLTALATIYFALHQALDELYLTRRPMRLRESPMHLGRFLEMAPAIGIYSARVCDSMLGQGSWPGFPTLLPAAIGLSLLVGLVYLGLLTWGYRPDRLSCYLVGIGGLLAGLAQSGWLHHIPAPKLSGFVILFHYLNWYIHYFLQLPLEARRTYLIDVTLVNAAVFLAFFSWGKEGPGRWFFQEANFYLWTLLHLITSTRSRDLSGCLQIPPRKAVSL